MLVDASAFHEDEPEIGPMQRALMLKTFPGFAALTGSELALLASICRERFFPKGTTMLEPGKPVAAFYMVIEGEVHVIRHGRVAQTLAGRSVVGTLASLTRDPKGTHAVAADDVFALEVHGDDMQEVFEEHFNITQGVITAMARTMRELQRLQQRGGSNASRKFFEQVKGDKPLTLVEKMFFLRKTSNFAGINIEALAALAAHTEEVRFEQGTEIWAADAPADWSILIMEGEVECFPPEGDSFSFPVGYIVGGLDDLARENHWYQCVAKTDVRALIQRSSNMFDVFEDHPGMSVQLLRRFAAGIVSMLDAMAAKQAAAERKSQAPAA